MGLCRVKALTSAQSLIEYHGVMKEKRRIPRLPELQA